MQLEELLNNVLQYYSFCINVAFEIKTNLNNEIIEVHRIFHCHFSLSFIQTLFAKEVITISCPRTIIINTKMAIRDLFIIAKYKLKIM